MKDKIGEKKLLCNLSRKCLTASMFLEDLILRTDHSSESTDCIQTLCSSQYIIDILNANGLTQHVTSPTHQKGHTLDLVITREHSNLPSGSPIVFISGVSDANSSSSLDHYAVLFYLNVNRPKTVNKSVKFRTFRKIPVPAYQNDVKVVLNNQSKTPDNINDLIDYYNSTLQNLTDKYAPLQCKKIALRPHSPWYTSALRQEKRAHRRGERVAARTQLDSSEHV